MAKKHKYHFSSISIDSALPIERVLDYGRQVVESQKTLRLDEELGDGFTVLVKSWVGMNLVHFLVRAESKGGRTHAVSELQEYRTSQVGVAFIPMGPKSIDGYGDYKRFMEAYRHVVKAADPEAKISIVEQKAV